MSLDYIILGYRTYDQEITHLKVCRIRNNQADTPEAKTKKQVVKDILRRDKEYYTALRDDDDFRVLKKLKIVKNNSGIYLRTDDREVMEDSLSTIPKF